MRSWIGRRKKLNAAAAISSDRQIARVYSCKVCNASPYKRERDKIKKRNGCLSPIRDTKKRFIWKTDECYVCGGENKKCKHCRGNNSIPVFRCPRAMAKEVHELLPYFNDWRISKRVMWPNGGTRMSQPLSLAKAFDFMDGLLNKYERESLENGRKTKS